MTSVHPVDANGEHVQPADVLANDDDSVLVRILGWEWHSESERFIADFETVKGEQSYVDLDAYSELTRWRVVERDGKAYP